MSLRGHKWDLELPKYIQLTQMILNIICILNNIDQDILLVLKYTLLAIPYSRLAIPYVVHMHRASQQSIRNARHLRMHVHVLAVRGQTNVQKQCRCRCGNSHHFTIHPKKDNSQGNIMPYIGLYLALIFRIIVQYQIFMNLHSLFICFGTPKP